LRGFSYESYPTTIATADVDDRVTTKALTVGWRAMYMNKAKSDWIVMMMREGVYGNLKHAYKARGR
jgi:hypothetical protein